MSSVNLLKDSLQPKNQSERNYSGSLLYRQRRDANSVPSEDTSDGALVQRKGRFKVTSADLSPKGPMNSFFSPVSGGSMSPTTPNFTAASLFPSLQYILQQNTAQREEIIKLIKYVEETSGKFPELPEAATNDLLQCCFSNFRSNAILVATSMAEKLYLRVSVSNAKINVADNTCFYKGEGATVSDERFATESWEPYGRIAETKNEKCPARKTIECFDQ
ncbi:hypothetical protein Patl1_02756 [Pistacia atlantica]|uniref:Uncharacterized protein n=1 Tax=Pistacia atlantica TaxID=434234 RepID=A0ACC1C5W4_9ROSI|nr:hypothetical protein Patl1_02756 [Pistacia atlantica]